jgi:hypothetical protein
MLDPRTRWILREVDEDEEDEARAQYADDHEDDEALADWLDE